MAGGAGGGGAGGLDVHAWLSSVEEYAALGIDQVWVGPDRSDPVGWTEQMCATVLPRLGSIG